jgi:hypothetical protein
MTTSLARAGDSARLVDAPPDLAALYHAWQAARRAARDAYPGDPASVRRATAEHRLISALWGHRDERLVCDGVVFWLGVQGRRRADRVFVMPRSEPIQKGRLT